MLAIRCCAPIGTAGKARAGLFTVVVFGSINMDMIAQTMTYPRRVRQPRHQFLAHFLLHTPPHTHTPCCSLFCLFIFCAFSSDADWRLQSDDVPDPCMHRLQGVTMAAQNFRTKAGGKGANEAVAVYGNFSLFSFFPASLMA